MLHSRILLLGAHGQLGRQLTRDLKHLGSVYVWGRRELDLAQSDTLYQALQTIQVDVIVNAAAYTAVDQAEAEQPLAFAINARSVQVLAEYAAQHNILLVHYSTDYVFDGLRRITPYSENDVCHPLNVYGASKLSGEQAILATGCSALIFRTSWLYSPYGNNFVKKILYLAKHQESLSIVADQYGIPTSAAFLGDVTRKAIKAYHAGMMKSGLYHVTAEGVATWHALAVYVVAQAMQRGFNIKLNLSDIQAVKTADYPSIALRPQYSCLNSQKIVQTLNITLPHWQQGIDGVLDNLLSTEHSFYV